MLLLSLVLAATSAQTAELGGRLGVGSDYIYRGLRLTQSGTAAEALIDVRTELGFYGGAWASRIDVPRDGRDVETGFFAGFAHRVHPDLALETTIVRYSYRGNSAFDYDYWEWFGSVNIGDRWDITLGVADGWWAADEVSQILEVSYRQPLVFGVNAEVTLGYNNVSAVLGEDYRHYGLALVKTYQQFTGRVMVIGSSQHVRRVLPPSIAPSSRWVAELSWSF